MNDEDSQFYLDFYKDEILYSYYVSLNKKSVTEEILTRKVRREVTIFHRIGDNIKNCLSEVNEIKKIKLKRNASVISMINNIKFEMDMKPLVDALCFFKGIASNVNYIGLRDSPINHGYHDICVAYKKYNNEPLKLIKKIIKLSDDSISDIVIKERINSEDGSKVYIPYFEHNYGNEKKP